MTDRLGPFRDKERVVLTFPSAVIQRQRVCTYCGAWRDVTSHEQLRLEHEENMARIKALPDDAPEKRFWDINGE